MNFIILSGFLVTLMQLKEAKLSSLAVYATIRWLRIIPPVVGVLCCTILAAKLGSGPLFQERIVAFYVRPCLDHWWAQLLLINNLWTIDQMVYECVWILEKN